MATKGSWRMQVTRVTGNTQSPPTWWNLSLFVKMDVIDQPTMTASIFCHIPMFWRSCVAQMRRWAVGRCCVQCAQEGALQSLGTRLFAACTSLIFCCSGGHRRGSNRQNSAKVRRGELNCKWSMWTNVEHRTYWRELRSVLASQLPRTRWLIALVGYRLQSYGRIHVYKKILEGAL